MAAQLDLDRRREPAQTKILSVGNQKGGLGEIILFGDGLQRRVRRKSVEQDDGGGIAGEAAVGESIDLKNGEIHGENSVCPKMQIDIDI